MTKLESILKQKGFSKTKLSRDSGVALSYIHEIINGKKSPTMRTLEKLAKGLGVKVADLIGEPKNKAVGE
jgi:transcriptional regulator with XRE-family HTH domain